MLRPFTLLILVCFASCSTKSSVKSHTIHIRSMKFDPAELIIHKGDTVKWINDDMVAHDVTEETKNEWSSGALETGKSWSKPIKGNTDYFCSIHVVMKGKIRVN